ncbi:MAG: HK97 family phage prohead protease [Caldilineaceae bacterium]|nr:HK97 family phage prohead protease [Caldilineaceae bacterium]
MDFPHYAGSLEIRQDGKRPVLRGRFPYDNLATVAATGRVRKERFRPGAFAFSIREALAGRARIDALVGHAYSKPLASTATSTLDFEDGRDALEFEAALPEEGLQPSWIVDLLMSVRGGLPIGISPGFNVPAQLAGASELVPEPGNEDVLIRDISEAVLFELSAVTRPAYQETDLQLRAAQLERRAAADLVREAELWLSL